MIFEKGNFRRTRGIHSPVSATATPLPETHHFSVQTEAIKPTSKPVQDSKDAKSNDTSLPAKPASKQYKWAESTEASQKIEGLGGRGL